MKKTLILIVLSLFTLINPNPTLAKYSPFSDIEDLDCDMASKALARLKQDISDGLIKQTERKEAIRVLKKNILGYKGDSEKCVLVSPDFVRVLSIDALAEFKDKRNKFIFENLLSYRSKYQAGDVRQHAALALSRISAKETVPKIMAAARDKQTYRVGYRSNIPQIKKPTIGELLRSEKRDLRKDPFSFPITQALNILAQDNHYELFRKAIIEELNFKSENKSNWNDKIRADMIRIAAKLKPLDAVKLIGMHSSLSSLDKLRAYAYIKSDRILKPLNAIIKKLAAAERSDVPEEIKLALYMINKLETKQSKVKMSELASSLDQTVKFMGLVFLSKNKDEKAIQAIKAKLPLVPDRLKIEGMKVLAELKDRNSVPIIKGIYSQGSKKMKTYAIWALAELKVTDLKSDTMKLMVDITPSDEREAKLDMIGTLKASTKTMQETKPVY